MIPEDTIDYNIRKTWYSISKMYNKTANEYMASMSLGMLILNIDIYDGTPSTQIGPLMGMESTSLSRSLSNLEERGIITRERDSLDKLLILHADHEQNCSASTVRIVGSSHASLYASISAGINALWGPLHGGANQAVIEMLEQIRNDDGNVKKYVQKAKDKSDPFRLMGFGHRVYKSFDPRARIIKKTCDEVLEQLGVTDPVLDVAKELEEIALKDQYFIDRSLYPNVDFYSGIIYRALGIPTDMFTVMFALGRIPGWIAQWKESREQNEPIGRPRQIYTGEKQRDYINIKNR